MDDKTKRQMKWLL